MSATEDRHTPTPEFVGELEQELLRAYRRDGATSGVVVLRPRWRERFRVAAMIAVGIAFGIGAQFASAQVRESKEAVEVSRTIEVERELIAYRLELAKRELERVRSARAVGAASEQTVREATLAQRESEIALLQRNLDLAEVRASRANPRNELWAPLVGQRDFVKERLLASAALVEERLKSAEADEVAVERNVKAGTELVGSLREAELQVAERERELRLLAMKSKLREQFLTERLEPVEVSRRLQQVQMEVDLARAKQLLDLATSRNTLMQERFKSGTTTVYEAKRAELEIMEREAELKRVMAEMKRTPRPEER
ncbi:MAG: hypothetical protein V4558_03775 [Gemmatimonadota bacterium]